jgi:hypothetical protein
MNKKILLFAALAMLLAIVPACHAQGSVKNTVWGFDATTPMVEAYGINVLSHAVFGDTIADLYQTWFVDTKNTLGQAVLSENNFKHGVPKKYASGTFTQSGETIRITFTEGTLNGTIRANVMTLTNNNGAIMTLTKVKSLSGLEPAQ